jgi:hypothetical protein
MKRILAVAAAVVVMALWGGQAFAGLYHHGDSLVCWDCHTMHFSQTHEWGTNSGVTPGTPSTGGNWIGASGPNHYLLKLPEDQICQACHDQQTFAPDVVAVNINAGSVADRQAGALNDGAGTGGYENFMGHTLGSTDTAPGGSGSFVPDATHGLTCLDCHHQHGHASTSVDGAGNSVSDAYRNLRSIGGKNVSYAGAVNNTTKDVFISSVAGFAAYTNRANVDFNESSSTNSGMGQWCTQCHADLHGADGDANMGGDSSGWLRHPTADADIGAIGRGHSSLSVFSNNIYRVKVMSATGAWGTQGSGWEGAPSDLTPTCVSCHKTHGNTNAFGLLFPNGGPMDEQGGGAGVAKDLCAQCHVQG